MSKNRKTPKIPLPSGWKPMVRSAVLHVLSLAQYTRSWCRVPLILYNPTGWQDQRLLPPTRVI